MSYTNNSNKSIEASAPGQGDLLVASPSSDTATHQPLTGVHVFDPTRLLPGPTATCHLADLGAGVIKIEDPGPGDHACDMMRTSADRATEHSSLFFRSLSRGKTKMWLDLKRTEDRDTPIEFVRHTDVLIESFHSGVMTRLGVDRDTLRATNSALAMRSASDYGQGEPLAKATDHDINYIGYADILDQLANVNDTPIVSSVRIGDLSGGAFTAVVGTLAVLVDARATGRGRYVDVPMADPMSAHNLMAFSVVGARGKISPADTGLLNGGVPYYGTYRAADNRFMAVGALELKFRQVMCNVIGKPAWKDSHWSLSQRVNDEEACAIRGELATLFQTAAQAEWTARFADTGCCVAPVLCMEGVLQHPLFVEHNNVMQKNGGPVQLALPLRFADWRTGTAQRIERIEQPLDFFQLTLAEYSDAVSTQ